MNRLATRLQRTALTIALLLPAAFALGYAVGKIVLGGPDAAAWMGAAASVALMVLGAAFLVVSLARERGARARRAARARAHAWLALRACEQALRAQEQSASAQQWFETVGAPPGYDRLQDHVFQIFQLTDGLDATGQEAARRAFTAFIEAADRINTVANRKDGASAAWLDTKQAESLTHLREASEALRVIVGTGLEPVTSDR